MLKIKLPSAFHLMSLTRTAVRAGRQKKIFFFRRKKAPAFRTAQFQRRFFHFQNSAVKIGASGKRFKGKGKRFGNDVRQGSIADPNTEQPLNAMFRHFFADKGQEACNYG